MACREAHLDEWQRRWSTSKNGRWTFRFFPEVRARLLLLLTMGHEVVQFMSGRRNFREYLAKFTLQPSPACACGNGDEDVEHVLYNCILHAEHMAILELDVHRAGHLWPCEPYTLVSTERLYRSLVRFARTAAYMKRLV